MSPNLVYAFKNSSVHTINIFINNIALAPKKQLRKGLNVSFYRQGLHNEMPEITANLHRSHQTFPHNELCEPEAKGFK